MKESHDPIDQADAGKDHIGPLGQKVLRLNGCDSSRFGARRVELSFAVLSRRHDLLKGEDLGNSILLKNPLFTKIRDEENH